MDAAKETKRIESEQAKYISLCLAQAVKILKVNKLMETHKTEIFQAD